MASLVPAAAKALFETALGDHFDTFKTTINVHKEAKKTITLGASQNIYAGYRAPKETVTYTPVGQSFSAIVTYKENQPLEYQEEIKANIEKGDVRIKVELACSNYINKGKTLSIEIGGKQFNVVSSEGARYFLSKTYYVFYLEATT